MKDFLKLVLNILARVFVSPWVLTYWIGAGLLGVERAFPGWSQLVSQIPGFTGVYLRRAFYKALLPEIGRDVWIGYGTLFSHSTASLGDRVYIGTGCMIGDVNIAADVLIGSNVSIINGNRQHGIERLDLPVREQPGVYPKVSIGQDTWIGDRAIVMTNLGEHCVVGSGSVVTKPVMNFEIVVGNPARVIGSRRAEALSGNRSESAPPVG